MKKRGSGKLVPKGSSSKKPTGKKVTFRYVPNPEKAYPVSKKSKLA